MECHTTHNFGAITTTTGQLPTLYNTLYTEPTNQLGWNHDPTELSKFFN